MSARGAIESRVRGLLRERQLTIEELQEYATHSGNHNRVKSIVEDMLEEERVLMRPGGLIELSEEEAGRAKAEARERAEQARLQEEYGPYIEAMMREDEDE